MAEEAEDAVTSSLHWPSWRFGPEGQSQIFDTPDEVPDGWEEHPSKVEERPASVKEAPKEDPYKDLTDEEINERLTTRKVQFSLKWPRDKRVSLLRTAEA